MNELSNALEIAAECGESYHHEDGPISVGDALTVLAAAVRRLQAELANAERKLTGTESALTKVMAELARERADWAKIDLGKDEIARLQAELKTLAIDQDSRENLCQENAMLRNDLDVVRAEFAEAREALYHDIGKIILAIDDGNLSLAKYFLLSALAAKPEEK